TASGRAAWARACALRSLAAAANSMALVICGVYWIGRMRRRRLRSVLMESDLEGRLELLHRLAEPGLVGVGQVLRCTDAVHHLPVLAVDERQPLGLEAMHRLDRNVVEGAGRAGPDRDHLLLDRHRHVLVLLQQLDHALA